jgi:23S rRNA U2552 (ribose-2'-O)-methylase RlmE/FtsJ
MIRNEIMILNNPKIKKLKNLETLCLNKIDKKDIYYFNECNIKISDKKKEIDNYDNNQWDKMKKLVNPYELIYTTSSKKYRYENISYYKPVSRSYFKLWEMHKDYNVIPNKEKLIVATLAEGPGGFLEAIINLRKINYNINKNDNYYGITLNNYNQYIPEWSLKKNQYLKIFYGNLYKYNTTENFIKLFNKNKADLVTADGGFDYSDDFNGQEINSNHIILAETIHAFLILNYGGNYICKFFDLFSKPILKIIYTLYSFFDTITIIKPKTSRPANSEKYILCKGFKGI